jgi:hypothetical protein
VPFSIQAGTGRDIVPLLGMLRKLAGALLEQPEAA